MNRQPDWNDWRIFLAVARTGSTLAAGRALAVSQSTAARRIAALEGALAVRLFERRASGYRLTVAGTDVLAAAQQLEAAALAAEDLARSHARTLSGTVRVTTEEVFAVTLLAPILRELHERHPEIRIDLDTTQGLRDLGAGEADVAVRSTSKAQAAGVVGRVLTRDDWALYCSRSYAQAHGRPQNPSDLLHHNIVGGGGGGLWRTYSAWLDHLGLQDRVSVQYGSSSGLLSAVKAGIGIAALPCIVADADPDLIACLRAPKEHDRKMWLLTHERVRRTSSVRLVIDFLYDRLMTEVRRVAQLEPDPSQPVAAAPAIGADEPQKHAQVQS
jgi:DNA-binding transcriptional LysR family regulator